MLSYTEAFRQAVYAPSRKSTARIYFALDGVTTLYDSSKIISFKIIEELSIISDTVTSNQLTITMDNTDDIFSFLNNVNADQIISKRPEIKVEVAIQLADLSYEWKQMGTFYLTEWQNEIGSMTVTMTAHDNFDMLSQTPYTNNEYASLYDLATDILTVSNIADYFIDDSLKTLFGAFVETIDSRKALQLIAIASRCILVQNRSGTIELIPLIKQGITSYYYTYTGMPGMYVGMTTPIANDSYDIKNISYTDTYQEPKVKLEKPIYEAIINGVSYKNQSITSGQSVTIDNVLISAPIAQDVANWIFTESNKTATYSTSWRQNPIIECGDVIIMQNSFATKKQTIVIKQEFEFNGALYGATESKGGI